MEKAAKTVKKTVKSTKRKKTSRPLTVTIGGKKITSREVALKEYKRLKKLEEKCWADMERYNKQTTALGLFLIKTNSRNS